MKYVDQWIFRSMKVSCFSIEKPPQALLSSTEALLLGIDEQATVPLGEYSSQLQKLYPWYYIHCKEMVGVEDTT